MPKSVSLSSEEIENLKGRILSGGLKKISTKSKHEILRIQDGDVSLILYKSGKLVFKENEETLKVVDAVLEKEKEFDYVMGSDEAGKGEWYGPLVVEGVALFPKKILDFRKLGVRDSKKMKKNQVMKLAEELINHEFVRASRVLLPGKYNEMYEEFKSENKSLNDMMAWAHSAVIKDIQKKIDYEKANVVIDKFDYQKTEFRLENLDKRGLEIIQKTKGESEIPVAAAGIIAKYVFEKKVDELEEEYGIDLRSSEPEEIESDVLLKVAKIHFKNVPVSC